MVDHRVRIFEDNGRFWAEPGRVEAKDGEKLVIHNETGLHCEVFAPKKGVLRWSKGDEWSEDWEFDIAAKKRKGAFPYQVYLYGDDKADGTGRREYAEGNSAPHVIID